MNKLLFAAVSLIALAACGRVPPGEEGVIVNLYGDGKGVDATPVGTGWHFYGMGKELVTYPVFEQATVFQAISFQDKDGLRLTADIGVNYWVVEGMSAKLFEQYRRNADDIIAQFMQNEVRNEFNRLTATMTAEEIYSSRRSELLDKVMANLKAKYDPEGLFIKNMYWSSEIDLPVAVKNAINSKIEATQIAAQRRNEVEQSKAQADKDIEQARGVAESTLLKAEARAKAIELEGQAIRNNPQVIQLREVERWDGKMPTTYVTDGNSTGLLLNSK